MICGFCGYSAPVADYCPHCKRCLVAKRTSHWEGGKGTRNLAALSRKDSHKFAGKNKSISNHAKKKIADRKRGNHKKDESEAKGKKGK